MILNETLAAPIAITVAYFVNTIKIVAGGFFGIYLITFIYRFITFRKLKNQIKELLTEVEHIKKRLARLEKKGRKSD